VAVTTTGAPGGSTERVLRIQRNMQEKQPWRVVGSLPSKSNLPKLEGELSGEAPPPMLRMPPTGPTPPGHP